MPYVRGYGRRYRRRGTSSRLFRKRISRILKYGSLPAARGYNLKLFNKGVEAKYIDYYIGAAANTALYATPVVITAGEPLMLQLNGIPQGSGVSNRVGNKIKLVSVTIHLEFQVASLEQQTDSTPGAVGYCLVLDRQPNGALPLITQILAPYSVTSNEIMAYSMINLDNRARFKILSRGIKTIGGFSQVDPKIPSGGPYSVFFRKHKKISFYTTYQGTDNSPSSISTNSLLLLILGPGNTGNPTTGSFYDSSGPYCNGVVRVRYVDA
jgi:hypothetical protein